jgi:hypothetical protein
MVEILAELIKSNFELINPKQIVVYDSKKIDINLRTEKLITNVNRLTSQKKQFNNHERVRSIAEKIFDVDFLYETKDGIGPAVFFMPSQSDDYNMNHKGHYIQVHLPEFYPRITIGTGIRTEKHNFVLLKQQREHYFEFVKKVYDEFLAKYTIAEIFR